MDMHIKRYLLNIKIAVVNKSTTGCEKGRNHSCHKDDEAAPKRLKIWSFISSFNSVVHRHKNITYLAKIKDMWYLAVAVKKHSGVVAGYVRSRVIVTGILVGNHDLVSVVHGVNCNLIGLT